MSKEWKMLEGTGGRYKVSSIGEILNVSTGKTLNANIDAYGYTHVRVAINGKPITRKIHRIVAQHFIPNPENKSCVNHKNGIKTDNRVENLEWVTHSENLTHAYRKLNRIRPHLGKCGKLSFRSKKVTQFRMDGALIASYESVREAARLTGLSPILIAKTCLGRRQEYKGFIWKY